MSIAGLRFSPDLDSLTAELQRPSARAVTFTVRESLRRAGLLPRGAWETLDDDSVASAITRGFRMGRGESASGAASAQVSSAGVDARVRVLPSSDEPLELHAVTSDSDGAHESRHLARWLNDPERRRLVNVVVAGADRSQPAPGVLAAIREADIVVIAPMSPTLDAAGFLAVPGLRDALRGTSARVVAISPVALPGGRDPEVEAQGWALVGDEPSSAAVARLYGDFLDTLVIDDSEAAARYPTTLTVTRAPLAAAFDGDDESDAIAAVRRAVGL